MRGWRFRNKHRPTDWDQWNRVTELDLFNQGQEMKLWNRRANELLFLSFLFVSFTFTLFNQDNSVILLSSFVSAWLPQFTLSFLNNLQDLRTVWRGILGESFFKKDRDENTYSIYLPCLISQRWMRPNGEEKDQRPTMNRFRVHYLIERVGLWAGI